MKLLREQHCLPTLAYQRGFYVALLFTKFIVVYTVEQEITAPGPTLLVL